MFCLHAHGSCRTTAGVNLLEYCGTRTKQNKRRLRPRPRPRPPRFLPSAAAESGERATTRSHVHGRVPSGAGIPETQAPGMAFSPDESRLPDIKIAAWLFLQRRSVALKGSTVGLMRTLQKKEEKSERAWLDKP